MKGIDIFFLYLIYCYFIYSIVFFLLFLFCFCSFGWNLSCVDALFYLRRIYLNCSFKFFSSHYLGVVLVMCPYMEALRMRRKSPSFRTPPSGKILSTAVRLTRRSTSTRCRCARCCLISKFCLRDTTLRLENAESIYLEVIILLLISHIHITLYLLFSLNSCYYLAHEIRFYYQVHLMEFCKPLKLLWI